MTTLSMPAVISDYINAANHHDSDAVIQCFNADGEVLDEGKVHRGHAAIHQWKEESSKKYHPFITPIAAVTEGNGTVVECSVSGDFPGSPVNLRFAFTLENSAIAALEITL